MLAEFSANLQLSGTGKGCFRQSINAPRKFSEISSLVEHATWVDSPKRPRTRDFGLAKPTPAKDQNPPAFERDEPALLALDWPPARTWGL